MFQPLNSSDKSSGAPQPTTIQKSCSVFQYVILGYSGYPPLYLYIEIFDHVISNIADYMSGLTDWIQLVNFSPFNGQIP
ncbi:hypothetical protein NC651_039757 [Populus alba x Populus x berolinensis]|nr:hypothetical protein NC651_039757 [Populus alba x Populus x berolinensis]